MITLERGELVHFDWQNDTIVKSISHRTFKKFDRTIIHYANGYTVIIRYYAAYKTVVVKP